MSNLVHVDEPRADFFVTGNEYMRDSLDLRFIPHVSSCNNDNWGGVILADDNQDLQQSCLIAKSVFERTKPGTIKFVLVGLSSYNVSANENKLTVANPPDEKVLEDYFKLCVDNAAKPVAVVLPVHSAVKKIHTADTLKTFRDTINRVVKKYKAVFVDLLDAKISDMCFKDKAHLNSDGSAAISALLGTKLYFANVVSLESIIGMDNDFFNVLSKYFPDDCKNLIHHTFCKMACDDFKRLSETLPANECKDLMAQVFSVMTYNHLAKLSDMLSKDDYNDLADRIFKISVEKIRRKDKIKVGFYFADSSMYFGDDLYNFFARDERFEPILFGGYSPDIAEKFKAHGVNVFDLNDKIITIPEQDVFFCLTPYLTGPPVPFRLVNLKVTTLMAWFPYSFGVDERGARLIWHFFRVLWRVFFHSKILLELNDKACKVGMPRGVYSGYPKQDVFFKPDQKFHFDWKMTRPDAKKIIWAPHHSIINKGPLFATFQWNYQFMYEFAKSHPEISWIVKPHFALRGKTVKSKLFSSLDVYDKYMQKWNDLPNAQVYTGPYYQDVFATSDGMIQDSDSFVAEYQYVNKPMIFLTRETQKFNELGEEILKASYTVYGKDLEGIAAMIQRVFIEGDDYKAAERKAVFDRYLNYPKDNGMLASEFIYKSISQDLKG